MYLTFSYLIGRQHFLKIDSNISNLLITNVGVPQGSIFGPVFSYICVADMTKTFSGSQQGCSERGKKGLKMPFKYHQNAVFLLLI